MSPRLVRGAVRGMLKARDPFELIRWLAYSQPDPRKALAELVQNSLDAGAATVRVTRLRDGSSTCLKIFDDGAGVIPEMERRDALQYVATHIGHSRKRHLSPQERLSLMTQGQYGIGLLGFWSLGERLEIRSAVPGHEPHRLLLYRDRPGYLIEPLREHLPLGDRWTEVVVAGLDDGALAATAGKRAVDYLAAELRGQLLARPVTLALEDRLARGGRGKVIRVVPPPLPGRPIAGIATLPVEGFGDATLDVGVWDGPSEASPGIALYCAGTRVADSFASLAALALDRAPWTDPRLTGVIDFPRFSVPPGSRDGVLPDDAALAFARALRSIESTVVSALAACLEAEVERARRVLLQDLRAAFEEVARRRPSLGLAPVAHAVGHTGPAVPRTRAKGLLPPGPVAKIVVSPDAIVLGRGERLVVRASFRDALGDPVAREITLRWATEPALVTVSPADGDASAAILHAGDEPGYCDLVVSGAYDGREIAARAPVEILPRAIPPGLRLSVPAPTWVEDAGSTWRSRLAGDRWEINACHVDLRSADAPAARLRYLTLLLAKEIALRGATPDEPHETVLERAVEIAAAAEAALLARGRGGARAR